jgi:hypothetical protein
MIDEESAEEEDKKFSAIISSISPLHLQDLALTTRRNLNNDLLPEISCVVSTPPRTGSFNIVYELSFSDGIKWAIRVSATGVRSCSFYLDIVTQQFISSKTSMPIPRIHDWSLDTRNILSYPYVIMDFKPGTKLWNDKNWITDVKRERIFEQIAEWMTELAALEFDQIGRLDWDSIVLYHFQTGRVSRERSKIVKNRILRFLLAPLTPPIHSCPSSCPSDDKPPTRPC